MGVVYTLTSEAIGRAKHNSVVVLKDGEALKAIVSNPNGLIADLQICADWDVELELDSTIERDRCGLNTRSVTGKKPGTWCEK